MNQQIRHGNWLISEVVVPSLNRELVATTMQEREEVVPDLTDLTVRRFIVISWTSTDGLWPSVDDVVEGIHHARAAFYAPYEDFILDIPFPKTGTTVFGVSVQ